MSKNLRYLAYTTVSQAASFAGHKPTAPIFIIGTGRCGSTLLVKILDSHPDLLGFTGEANDLWHPHSYPFSEKTIDTPTIIEDPAQFTERSIANWPSNHRQRLQQIFDGYHLVKGAKQQLFIKSAMISFMMPTLLELYPHAKFIHIYRNGPSVVASFLKKERKKYEQFFNSPDDYLIHCANYWNCCLLEIESQKEKLGLRPDQFIEFSYESLCEFPAQVLHKLEGFLTINSDQFAYDTSQIVSQNFKVGDYQQDEQWQSLLTTMEPAMRRKGYLA